MGFFHYSDCSVARRAQQAAGGVATAAPAPRRRQQLDYMVGATTLHVVRRRCGNMVFLGCA